jgi:hypothetical protein
MGIHTRRTVRRYVDILTNGGFKALSRGGRPYFWPVSLCGSGDYEKCVPSMGSTQVQEATEGQGVRRQRKSRNRRERERDTGKSAEKGVSWTGFDRKEVECCSDTGKTGEKGVSRMG